MKRYVSAGKSFLLFLCAACGWAAAQTVNVTVDAAQGHKPISPYIYGKNHGLSQVPGVPTSADTLKRYRDAGFRILRLNNGNNATKYHFRKKMSSHPDWYNNVTRQDWDQSALELQQELPGVQGLFAISMLGWAASNTDHNFNDWLYNTANWWSGVGNNWAGTTPITTAGQEPSGVHDPLAYLERWPVDSSVQILDHWFGSTNGALGLDSSRFRYWNLDNEPDIWSGTHDDVMPDTLSAEDFVQIYVHAAKLARARFPGIKLVGPVATNEWQWFFWDSELVPATVNGKDTSLAFMEYFVMRIAEEQRASGVRLLDVLDYHFYPDYNSASDKANILQLHRIWFDRTYNYPKANGVRWSLGGTKEYIFARSREWLDRYFGAGHGVSLGVTESGNIDGAKEDASVIAAWYASQLGEFANAGDVELFTPWNWYDGMFETVHLFTRYAKNIRTEASSSLDSLVSAYASVNAAGDSLTVILVNRDLSKSRTASVSLSGFAHQGSWAPTFRLADLEGETFRSGAQNALYANGVAVSDGQFSLSLPAKSVTAVVLSQEDPGTMPGFSSSSAASSSSSSAASTGETLVWDHSLGTQVRVPAGVPGGWLYNYADPLSSITEITAAGISAEKALRLQFDAVQDEDQTYNYAGVGFNWGSTAKGSDLVTVNLSAFSGICLDYVSSVDLILALGEPDAKDPAKQVTFATTGAAFAAVTERSQSCVPFSSVASRPDLTRQSAVQLQFSVSGELIIYRISLKRSSSPVLSATPTTRFNARMHGPDLLLDFPVAAAQVRLMNSRGAVVRDWGALPAGSRTESLQGLPAGRYWVQAGWQGVVPVVLIP